ncbi:unnamed protein product [Mytilus edulis]|uniref:Uncharacterized protein n=1 Tax=Mytilus edulis TaxID=6550 RepID=A0A8S3ST44_MYTED|nr:unnamed protein product [Mytilus edulis]
MDVCLYHADKCHFDIVTRDIEKAKIIPRNYVKRLAMCVCSCRKNKFKITDEVRQLDLQEMANYLGNCIKSEKWPVSLVSMLKPLLLDVRLQQYSQSMLVWILYKAINCQTYSLLDSLIKKKEPGEVPKKPEQKMTAVQFNHMINKKWRNSLYKIEVIVPMFAGNTKVLQNDERFQNLQLKHKDVVVKIDNKANSEFIDKNLKKTKVKLGGKVKDGLHEMARHLIKIGEDIQKILDKKRSDIFQKKKMARLQRKNYQDSNIDEPDESLLYKEEMTDLYKRRCEANRIGNKTRTPGASLKDGHCINCLDKFVTLKHPDVCKYHPGFIDLEGNWNCCGMKSQFNQPTLKEHQITGCSTGVHNWRHGKSLKQTKIKNYVFDWSAQLETW